MPNSIVIDYKKHLDIRLSKNVTTKPLLCVSTWITAGSKVNNIGRVTLSNKTSVLIVPTPSINFNRELTYLKINNYDSVSATVLINVEDLDNINNPHNLLTVLLSPNDTLFFNKKDGFYILDYLGGIKIVQNTVEIPTLTVGDLTNYYNISQTDLLLSDKSNTGHTHTISSLSGVSISTFNTYTANTVSTLSGVSIADFNTHTGATNPHGTTLAQLSGVSITDFNIYTGTTNPLYSLTGHTHDITSLSGVSISTFNIYTGTTNPLYSLTGHTHTISSLSGVSITDFNSHTGATNPHGTTLSQLSGVSISTFNIYTGITNPIYALSGHTHTISSLSGVSIADFNTFTGNTRPAYGSIYEHDPSGRTVIRVNSIEPIGWVSAIDNTHSLTIFERNPRGDRIIVSTGGLGTYQISATLNASFSHHSIVYNMGIYKNDRIITQAQSYITTINETDRHILNIDTIISGVSNNDFFDVRFTSDSTDSSDITVYHLTFNINRIN